MDILYKLYAQTLLFSKLGSMYTNQQILREIIFKHTNK